MLSPAEIALRTGLSRAAVYRAIERGELRAARLCGRLRIEPAEFEDWKARSAVRPRSRHSPMLQPRTSKRPLAREGTFLAELAAMSAEG